jgi:hypothetical protein
MTEQNDVKGEESNKGNEFYLGSWKTKEAAEEGLANMKALVDSQGNEVGALRKQMEMTQQTLESLKTQATEKATPKVETPDYSAEAEAIQGEMAKLDPDDDDYHRNLTVLITKSNNLAAKIAKEEALAAATAAFKEELNERDIKTTHSTFYKENPDFNTPEMQLRIKEYIAKDTTGMSDPLVAYREIQRDMVAEAAAELEKENIELKRIVELAKGTDSTGRVITKTGQTTPTQKQPKAVGADLDRGMQERLAALRE